MAMGLMCSARAVAAGQVAGPATPRPSWTRCSALEEAALEQVVLILADVLSAPSSVRARAMPAR